MKHDTGDIFISSAAGDLAKLRQILCVASPDQRDVTDRTPLMYACRAGQIDAAQLLLTAGADINASNANGTTALMYAKTAAVGSGNVALLELLLDAGADLNARDATGRTALDYVIVNSETVINFLIRRGALR